VNRLRVQSRRRIEFSGERERENDNPEHVAEQWTYSRMAQS
jgi:hypothetical protein